MVGDIDLLYENHNEEPIMCMRSLAVFVFLMLFCCILQPTLYAQKPLTVAVLPFEATVDSKALDGLDRALSEMLITDLSKVESLQIVERGRLHEVAKELKLPSEGFIDPNTAAVIGKGVGAKAILTGSFFVKETRIRIDARLIHVETGRIIIAEEIAGTTEDPFELEKQLQQKIVESLGVKLSQFEEAELSSKPTTNAKAAAAYGRAENLRDSGKLAEAKTELDEALAIDPDFELAKKLSERIEGLLSELEGERFDALIERIASFEFALFNWPRRSRWHQLGPYGITFKLNEYQLAHKTGLTDQMLFWWVSSLAPREAAAGWDDFYNTLFNEPGKHGTIDDYTSVGAHKINLFWCDVYSSIPDFTPAKPVTSEDVNPPTFSSTGYDKYRSRCYLQYESVLYTKATSFIYLAKMQDAAATAEKMAQLYRHFYSQGQQSLGEELLRVINDTSKDSNVLSQRRERLKIDAYIWENVEQRVLDRLTEKQQVLEESIWRELPSKERTDEFFSLVGKSASAATTNNALQCFELMGGKGILERFAEKMYVDENRNGSATTSLNYARLKAGEFRDEMLTKAKNHPFVIVEDRMRNSGGEYHVTGCPFAYRATNYMSTIAFTGIESPQDAIQKHYRSCIECQPYRWMDRTALIEMLRKGIPAAVEAIEALPEKDEVAKHDAMNHLRELLVYSQTVSDNIVLDRVADVVMKYALSARLEHEIQQAAILALARSSNPNHIKLLGEVLCSSVTSDIKLSAILSLKYVGNEQA